MIFYHIFCTRHWYDVVTETLFAIKRAQVPGVLRVQLIGTPLDEMHFTELAGHLGVAFELWRHERNFYEYQTIRDIWEFSKDHDGPACYIHSKGVTNPSPLFTKWRWFMIDRVIHQWKDRVRDLEHYDTVGCCLMNRWKTREFSGNFWWANHQWLRRLPEPIITSNRFWYEQWLLSDSEAKIKSLISTNGEPWESWFYPANGNPHLEYLDKAAQ